MRRTPAATSRPPTLATASLGARPNIPNAAPVHHRTVDLDLTLVDQLLLRPAGTCTTTGRRPQKTCSRQGRAATDQETLDRSQHRHRASVGAAAQRPRRLLHLRHQALASKVVQAGCQFLLTADGVLRIKTHLTEVIMAVKKTMDLGENLASK